VTSAILPHLFIVLQGLTGTGKSTAVENLTRALDGQTIRPVAGGRENALADADALESIADRCEAYLQANYLQRDAILNGLRQSDVVMEGYVYRTLAHHQAMGLETLPVIDWTAAVTPDLVVLLMCGESTRKERLMSRDQRIGKTPWHVRAEASGSVELDFYRQYGWPEVDTTDATPEAVTVALVALTNEARRR
jgi:thymidylate kinase